MQTATRHHYVADTLVRGQPIRGCVTCTTLDGPCVRYTVRYDDGLGLIPWFRAYGIVEGWVAAGRMTRRDGSVLMRALADELEARL